jgi:hypothetical protein
MEPFDRSHLIDHWPPAIKPVEGITPLLMFSRAERRWLKQQRAEHSLDKVRAADAASLTSADEQWGYGMGLSTRPAKVITKPRRPKPPAQTESLF